MHTRDQIYAATVYDQVSNVPKDKQKSYGSMAHKLPVLIRTAGLAQALAFVDARGKPAHKDLLAHLAVTVQQTDVVTLLGQARNLELREYMRLTQQVMAALLWYKRFAQSILGVDASEAVLEEEDKND